VAGLSKQQIGKCGELLVQYQLLLKSIESAHLTTDSGIDLVAYSAKKQEPLTIQVKSNLKPKPGGGKGKAALDWWIPADNPADLCAFVDLSNERVWLMTLPEVAELAQQHSSGRHHLYMYVDPTAKPRDSGRLVHAYEFERYLLENRAHEFFG
jgi:hypothetical protein